MKTDEYECSECGLIVSSDDKVYKHCGTALKGMINDR
jgi:hypothetical protein